MSLNLFAAAMYFRQFSLVRFFGLFGSVAAPPASAQFRSSPCDSFQRISRQCRLAFVQLQHGEYIREIIIIGANFAGNWVYGRLMSKNLLQIFWLLRIVCAFEQHQFSFIFYFQERAEKKRCFEPTNSHRAREHSLIKTLTFAPPIKINSIP